ncbi:MAG: YndJ family transporter [Sandaracinaceae bacterium]
MRTESLLWSNAIFGISLGVLLRFAHGPGAEPVARILTLGVLGIVPLALLVAPSVGPTWDRLRTWTAWALPLAGVSAVVSLWLDPPRGAPWVAPWMAACLLVASLGVVRLFAGRGFTSAARWCSAAALGYLPVGAAWLVAARMGVRPMGFDPAIVTLTAVHFHFAALAGPMYASRVIDALEGRARAVASGAGLALVAAIPIVAIGFSTSPVVGMVGTVLLAAGLVTLALLAAIAVPLERRAAKVLLWISALSVLLSMPLALYYQWGQVTGADTIGLEWMVRLHGFANAHGFATCGLLAWAIEDRAGQSTSSAKGPSERS